MNRTDRLKPAGVPKYIRVYDDGGKSFDRYTCVFTGNYRSKTLGDFIYLGMSTYPFHPQGCGQHGSSRNQIDRPTYSHLGRKVKWDVLPADVKKCIIQTYDDLWGLKGNENVKAA